MCLPVSQVRRVSSASDSESYTSAKIRALIDCVAEINSIHVLQATMDSIIDPSYVDCLSSNTFSCLRALFPDSVKTSQIFETCVLE